MKRRQAAIGSKSRRRRPNAPRKPDVLSCRRPGRPCPWRHEGAATFIAAPHALAIDSDHAIGRTKPEPLAQRCDKPGENLHHLLRIQETEHAAEAVMARRAIRELNDFRKQLHVSSGKICHSDTRVRSAQSRRQRNEQYCRKLVPRIEVSRVTDFTENRKETLHADSPESGKPPSESSFSSSLSDLA